MQTTPATPLCRDCTQSRMGALLAQCYHPDNSRINWYDGTTTTTNTLDYCREQGHCRDAAHFEPKVQS